MPRSTILICGPSPAAVGGGPTHMRNLWASPLASEFDLVRFETGSRGAESPARDEPAPAMLWRIASGPFRLAAVIARRRPAVVHLNTSVDPKGFWREWGNLIVCRLFGRRIVYQVHGGRLERLTRHRWMRPIVRRTFGWPDVVVLLASFEQAEFARVGTVRRMVVIPNGIDARAFRGDPPREHGGHVRRLACLGRLIPGKGLLECVEAVRMLRDDPAFAGLELHIAGSGPERAALEERIARDGLQAQVKLVGPLAGSDTAAFLRAADVFLLPTALTEGLPYAVLESLAAGTPVIATRAGGIPDIMRDPDHGRFVPPRDPAAIATALRDLAASPERLRAMSRACAEWAGRELGLDRLARQFGALYRELGAR